MPCPGENRGAVMKKQLYNVKICYAASAVERAPTAVIIGVEVAAAVDKDLHDLYVLAEDGGVEVVDDVLSAEGEG